MALTIYLRTPTSRSREGIMRSKVIGRALAAATLGLLLGAPPLRAQTSSATLHGTVTDTGGGVLPGVTVKLQSSTTGLQREVVTNAVGVYVFNFLPAGPYVVSAELSGFKSVRHGDIQLEIGQSLTFNIRLEVGGVEEV